MAEASQQASAGAAKKPKAAKAPKAGAARAEAAPARNIPTEAQLNDRDWHKAGPRRLAGPPLMAGPGLESLANQAPPPATDPKAAPAGKNN